MNRLRNLSIKTKLTLLLAGAAASSLLLACIVFGLNYVISMRRTTVQHMSAVADVVGANTVAAVTFNRPGEASEALSSLSLEPIVRFACVYDRDHRPFATYSANNESSPVPPLVGNDGYEFTDSGTLDIFTPIFEGDERIGTLYVQASMEHLQETIHQWALMAVAVAVAALVVSIFIASRLQKIISAPILRLAETSDQISKEGNYTVRVRKRADDEIGSLYDAFNRMLEQTEIGKNELKKARDELEIRVDQRTQELSAANDDLVHEVAVRKKAEEELRELQATHIAAARRAGMAEIATSVLHNVGNVLNSVNVSATMISDRLRRSCVSDLARVGGLIEEYGHDFGKWVSSDEQGRYLPRFLLELSRQMSSDEEAILAEVNSLSKNIQHVKDIVSLQQSHAGVSGLSEVVPIVELINDAIEINSASMLRHGIRVQCEFEEIPPSSIDKQKVIQIMVNLIANAKYAVMESSRTDEAVTVRLLKQDEMIRIDVIDNGVGIPKENMTKIFSHGFTTRKDGHGFGLHSAALAAKEMEGTLSAYSDGPGTGARFILEIPLRTAGVAACATEIAS